MFVIFLPFLGVFVHLIARGGSMNARSVQDAQAQRARFDDYPRATAGSSSSADEIAKLADLRDRGVLTEAEFAIQKSRILA